jgi:hypothetical protein
VPTSFEYTTATKSWIYNSLLKAENRRADHLRARQPDRTPSINLGRSLCNLARLPMLSSLGCPHQLQINLLASAAHWAESLEPIFRTNALFAVAPVFKPKLSKLPRNSLSHLTSFNLMLLSVGLQGSCILILVPDRFDLTVGGRRRLFSWTRTTLQLLLDIITYSRLII